MKPYPVIICLFIVTFPILSQPLQVDTNYTVGQYVLDILLSNSKDIKVEHIKYSGPKHAIGYFTSCSDLLPVNRGIVLSTGSVLNIKGPNVNAGISSENNTLGDNDLDKIANGETFDAAVLEFDFSTKADSISFDYFFASEEYPEYVNDNVDDVFGFFIHAIDDNDKRNIALLPGAHEVVSIDNVNDEKNEEFFIQNKILLDRSHFYYKTHPEAYDLSLLFEMDGYTTLLKAGYKIIPGKKYHLKLAIADVGDNIFDSDVFLSAGSLRVAGRIKKLSDTKMQLLKSVNENEVIHLEEDSTGISITLNVKFAYNSYTFSENYHAFLYQIAGILTENNQYRLELIGHTDDVGDDNCNMQLSEKRAEAIANFLINNGIEKNRIRFYGLGDTHPIIDEKTEYARAINRRVDFILHKQ